MEFHFKLLLIGEIGGRREKIYASDFLHGRETSDGLFNVDTDNSTIDLFTNGQSYISPSWNLGRLDWLLPQFKNALNRLRNNELVLVRSAVIEGSEIPYLVFQPHEAFIKISLLVFDDFEIEQIFPSGPFSERSHELYQYFYDNKNRIFNDLAPIIQENPGFIEYFIDLKIAGEEFLNSLRILIEELELVLSENRIK